MVSTFMRSCILVFIGFLTFPSKSFGLDFVCPKFINSVVGAGWELVKMESKLTREKPQIFELPKNTYATVTQEIDPTYQASFPEAYADVIDNLDGSMSYEWKLPRVPDKERSGYYASCVFSGEQRYARQPLPNDDIVCTAKADAKGVFSTSLKCSLIVEENNKGGSK